MSAFINYVTSRDPSKPARKTKVARFKDPVVNARMNPDAVQLSCRICGAKQSRIRLISGVLYSTNCGLVIKFWTADGKKGGPVLARVGWMMFVQVSGPPESAHGMNINIQFDPTHMRLSLVPAFTRCME